MVKLTVYASARDFDLANYMNVTKRIEIDRQDYYTNTDAAGATLYGYSSGGRHHYDNVHWSPLYLGHAAAPDGKITGMIGDKPVAEWLAGKDLADYTPETLANRIFVGDDHLRGNIGDDVLDGHAGADTLMGREGDDTLIGGVGDDILIGGFGNDTLIGGFGADHFVIRARYDLIGGGEIVTDFSHAQGDVIDLTRFDADGQTEGQQPIAFIGEAAFGATGAAEVRVEATSEGVNTLQFDTNGDGTLDVVLTVNTATLLDATDVMTVAPDTARPLSAAVFGADSIAAVPHVPHFQHIELAAGHLA